MPYIKGSNEHKSKPTQHSVRELQSLGIRPDIIVTRSDESIDESTKQKIALFCNVKRDCVIENITLPILYEAPLMLEAAGLADIVCRELHIPMQKADLTEWIQMVQRIKISAKRTKIALVGKYVKLYDAYLSIVEALSHAGYEQGAKVEIEWIDSETITPGNVAKLLEGCDGVIVPGGFGNRGIEGKIVTANYARVHKLPYFGICLGMQIAVIEYARNVLGYLDASSSEFEPESHHLVIDFMPDQYGNIPKGGTMRLGAYPCKIKEGSRLDKAYKAEEVLERHRHRYEFNNAYRKVLEEAGLSITGTSPDERLVEAVEIMDHPFYVGVQYHPEFKSRPNKAHPLFREFIKSALKER